MRITVGKLGALVAVIVAAILFYTQLFAPTQSVWVEVANKSDRTLAVRVDGYTFSRKVYPGARVRVGQIHDRGAVLIEGVDQASHQVLYKREYSGEDLRAVKRGGMIRVTIPQNLQPR